MKQIDGVTFIPARCSRCGRRLAWVAADKSYAGSVIVLTGAHNCEAKDEPIRLEQTGS